MVPFNDFNGAREILIDTDRPSSKPDLLETAELLGLQGEAWYAPVTGNEGVAEFIAWTKCHLNNDIPVAIGVVFEDEVELAYSHIVTAVQGMENGLRFNDHYSKATKSVVAASLPQQPNEPCTSYEYCFGWYNNGVALMPPPPSVTRRKERLVRLKVTSSDPFTEPNWTCSRTIPKNTDSGSFGCISGTTFG
jgi:hypothetical protein